jgi:hypothetical protein
MVVVDTGHHDIEHALLRNAYLTVSGENANNRCASLDEFSPDWRNQKDGGAGA